MMVKALIACGLSALFSLHVSAAGWPRIKPVSATFPVDLSGEKISIDLQILDQANHPLYHFACRGGDEAYLEKLGDETGANWVPPLMCTLSEGAEAREESLLSEDDSAAWFSRGQFRADELVGACARYPEYGVHRTFDLRGFRLTLDALDVKVDSHGLAQSFILAVKAAPNPSANTEHAAQTGYLTPYRVGYGCNMILKGNEPRMCRDWTHGGSWTKCKDR